MQRAAFLLCIFVSSAWAGTAQDVPAKYAVFPNITYLTADAAELKLDLYLPRANLDADTREPVPTLIFFHGGGWIAGSKEQSALHVLPYLERGWAAVNVQYRLGGTALAPAAVEDTRCALRWVARNARSYGFDQDRLVLSGRSAGGHLALITAMVKAKAGFDNRCAERLNEGLERASARLPEIPVAAVINWAGITDVYDLIAGPNATNYAVAWVGGQPDGARLAQRVSPLSHVRADVPPILTLHGTKDRVVPFAHATRLHEALDAAGVANRLHRIEGREHFADFTIDDATEAFAVIDAFLQEHVE